MTWLLILKKLKTFWAKFKYYPIAIAIFIFAVYLVFIRKDSDRANEIVDKLVDRHKKELEIIENSYHENTKKKQEITEKYHKVIKEIEDKHKVQNDKLNANYKKEVDKIVKKYYNDPKALTKKLSEIFGIDYKE
jgi:Mg2+ and Co2+ transporter CorA